MANVDDIIARIETIVQDTSFSEPDILAEINRCARFIASGPQLPDRSRLAPLPDLFTSDSVDTVSDDPFVTLPEAFDRSVVKVYNTTANQEVVLADTWRQFYERHPALDQTGDVVRAAVKGKKLWYQGVPATPQTLKIYFYEKPAVMAIGGETSGIPEQFVFDLLVNFAAREIFSMIDGDDGQLAGTVNKHDAMFNRALMDLDEFLGPEERKAWNVGEDIHSVNWFDEV